MSIIDTHTIKITKSRNTHSGVAFEGQVIDADGSPVVSFRNDGHGGSNIYRGDRDVIAQLETVCAAATGQDYEALDSAISGAANGESLATGAARFREQMSAYLAQYA